MTKRKQTPDVLAEILGGEGTLVAVKDTTQTTRAPGSRQQDPLPEPWEYAIVTFQDYKGWRPRYINGHELKDWMSGPLIHEYLAEMGEEAWELAAASAGDHMYGSADNHQLFFKRLKSE